MPEIFADQHAHASKTRIKGADRIAVCKEAAFIKQCISGQINFVMNMEHASGGEIGGGNVKAVTRILIHKADHNVEVLTRFEQRLEDRIIIRRFVGNRGS